MTLGADDVGETRGFLHRYSQASKWIGNAQTLRTFTERLREEHQRLEAIENKSRSVLAAATVLVSFASFGASAFFGGGDRGWLVTHETLAVVCRFAAIIGILFLGFAVLLSFLAGRIDVRWYVDPVDLDRAQGLIKDERTSNGDVLTAAVAMHFKDRMAVTTQEKLYALEAAMNSLRNGLGLVILAVMVEVLGRF
jgi:hypothetical protein